MEMLLKRVFLWEEALELEKASKVAEEETDSQSSPNVPKVIMLKVTGLLEVSSFAA